MLNWIKILILRCLLFCLKLMLMEYKVIYLFLDRFIPDRKSKTDSENRQKIYGRDDIFSGEKFFDDFWDDDEFMNKDADEFKEMLTVCIILAIAVVAFALLTRAEGWMTNYIQQKYNTANDIFTNGLIYGGGVL
ncbi:MAG: hypothetical protein IKV52_00340 [Oscillospiraceae bacterium]|nr:hypothetical protein [Oscillospiraceae bacterium]